MSMLQLKKAFMLMVVSLVIFSTLTVGIQHQSNQQAGSIAGTIQVQEKYEPPQKIAWDGSDLWASNQNTGTIYEFDPSTGDVKNSFESNMEYPSGIEVNGSEMWVVSGDSTAEPRKIYKFDVTTGELVNKIPAPGNSPEGIAYDGNSLWLMDRKVTERGSSGRKLFQIDPKTGDVIDSIDASGVYSLTGLAWGNGFLWGSSGETILQIDTSTPSSEPVKKINSPYQGTGIAWDGQYLWRNTVFNHSVARIDPGSVGQTNSPPNATIKYSPKNPAAGGQISFDASASTDSNGFVENYQWDFDGDGISDSQGQRATYAYNSPGSYTVNLTVTDDNGVTGSTEKKITISAGSSTQSKKGDLSRDPTPTRNTNTPTAAVSEPSNKSDTTTQHSYISGNQTDSTATQMRTNRTSNSGEPQKKRGFISNGEEPDILGFFSDPLAVTIAGFVVSALGIIVQLFGGR